MYEILLLFQSKCIPLNFKIRELRQYILTS